MRLYLTLVVVTAAVLFGSMLADSMTAFRHTKFWEPIINCALVVFLAQVFVGILAFIWLAK